jgi:hypothetical protein
MMDLRDLLQSTLSGSYTLDRTTTIAGVRMMTRKDLALMAMLRGRLADGEPKLREANAMAREAGYTDQPLSDSIELVLADEWLHGDRERASDGPMYDDPLVVLTRLRRAFDQANEPDSAIAMYEQYLQTGYARRGGNDYLMLAPIQKQLGELYEAKGNAARAASHFAAFVSLWKSADPELQPAVAEVRRRLGRGS